MAGKDEVLHTVYSYFHILYILLFTFQIFLLCFFLQQGPKSFSFDSVATGDNIQVNRRFIIFYNAILYLLSTSFLLQGLHSELLQPLVESVLKGYNGALLMHGASTEKTSTLIDRHIIKPVKVSDRTAIHLLLRSLLMWPSLL